MKTKLGGYSMRDGPGCLPYALPGALTLHDLGELIRRAGRSAGFVVESEYRVRSATVKSGYRAIDWVWLCCTDCARPVAAFEIEGWNVPVKSILADKEKLLARQPMVRVIALYQISHDRTSKRSAERAEDARARVETWLGSSKTIQVFVDEDLVSGETMSMIMTRALTIGRKRHQQRAGASGV